jgi:hypothetical protein
MQDSTENDLRNTPLTISGSFGNVPETLLENASNLMDRAIAQSHYREVLSQVSAEVSPVRPPVE